MDGVPGRARMTGDPFADRLAALRARFVARCAEDREILAGFAAPFPPAAREAMRGIAHRLAGAAGTFGFPAASEAALRLEEACEAECDDAALVGALGEMDSALAAVRAEDAS